MLACSVKGYKCIVCQRKTTFSGIREVKHVASLPGQRLPHRYGWRIRHSCRLAPGRNSRVKDAVELDSTSSRTNSAALWHSPSLPTPSTLLVSSSSIFGSVTSSSNSCSPSGATEQPLFREHDESLVAHVVRDSVDEPPPPPSGTDTVQVNELPSRLDASTSQLPHGQMTGPVFHDEAVQLASTVSLLDAGTQLPRRQHGHDEEVREAIGPAKETVSDSGCPSSSIVDWSGSVSSFTLPLELPEISATVLLAMSRLTHNAPIAGSSDSQPILYQQRLRAFAQQLEEKATAIQSGDAAESTDDPSRFDRLHADTKSLEAMYREYRKRCDLTAGADKDTSDLPEKRARRPPSSVRSTVQPTHCIPDTVSPGYGECTRAAFDKICQYLCDELPAPLGMGQDSVFLDIGSGYGKCVVHARFRAGVRKSIGIEYISKRHELAIEMLRQHLPSQFPTMHARLTPQSLIELLEGDATSDEFHDVFHSATHVFMFDWVFSTVTTDALLDKLKTCSFAVLVCCQPPQRVQHILPLVLLHKMAISTTGKQSFTCYCYARASAESSAPSYG